MGDGKEHRYLEDAARTAYDAWHGRAREYGHVGWDYERADRRAAWIEVARTLTDDKEQPCAIRVVVTKDRQVCVVMSTEHRDLTFGLDRATVEGLRSELARALAFVAAKEKVT